MCGVDERVFITMTHPKRGRDNGLRLLLVDDDEACRFVVKRSLDRLGLALQVHEARDAEDAMQVLDTTPVDVVLTDYKMNGKNGVDVLCYTMERQPHARRVLMSGTINEAMLRAAASKECVHHAFEKPMGLSEWKPALLAALKPGERGVA